MTLWNDLEEYWHMCPRGYILIAQKYPEGWIILLTKGAHRIH